jgi:hypothetical protein
MALMSRSSASTEAEALCQSCGTPMKPLKHLPENLWPEDDHRLFEAAYREGDIFDDNRGQGVTCPRPPGPRSTMPGGAGWASWTSIVPTSSTSMPRTASRRFGCVPMSSISDAT